MLRAAPERDFFFGKLHVWIPPSRLNTACKTRLQVLLVIPEGLWVSIPGHVILVAALVTPLLTVLKIKPRKAEDIFFPSSCRSLELPGSQSCPFLSSALEGRRLSGGGPLLTMPGISQ